MPDRISEQLKVHMGKESTLYGKLNSDQRDVHKKVWEICEAYEEVLQKRSENGISQNSIPIKEDASLRFQWKSFSIPVLGAAVGALIGSLPDTGASAFLSGAVSAGCAIVGGGVGAGIATVLQNRKLKRTKSRPEGGGLAVKENLLFQDETAIVDKIVSATEELLQLTGRLSQPQDTGYNITEDTHFAKWVQKVMAAVWKGDDRYLKVLVTDELDARLSEMGLFVCMEPDVENGRLVAPYDRLFQVRQKELAEPKVVIPAICFGEDALVKGEIWI